MRLWKFYVTEAVAFYKQVRQDHVRIIIVAAAIAGTSYAIMARPRNRDMHIHSRGHGTGHHQCRRDAYYALNRADTFTGQR